MRKTIYASLVVLPTLFFLNGCVGYDGMTAEEWADEYYACEDRLYKYENALEEANNTIGDLNYIIDDAQGHAWSSYDDMGYALDNMYTLDTVDAPL